MERGSRRAAGRIAGVVGLAARRLNVAAVQVIATRLAASSPISRMHILEPVKLDGVVIIAAPVKPDSAFRIVDTRTLGHCALPFRSPLGRQAPAGHGPRAASDHHMLAGLCLQPGRRISARSRPAPCHRSGGRFHGMGTGWPNTSNLNLQGCKIAAWRPRHRTDRTTRGQHGLLCLDHMHSR